MGVFSADWQALYPGAPATQCLPRAWYPKKTIPTESQRAGEHEIPYYSALDRRVHMMITRCVVRYLSRGDWPGTEGKPKGPSVCVHSRPPE